MDRKEINAAIFQDTVKFADQSEQLRTAIGKTKRTQRLILAKDNISENGHDRDRNARIVVSGKRTLEAASAYKGKKTCILNFASATNPGGGVARGSSAQEESLCRCSTLYFCLDTPDMRRNFYEPHRRANNPLYNDDIIYSPDVVVVKTDTDRPERMNSNDWYCVNVITCAASNLRERPSNPMNPFSGNRAAKITETELEKLLERRVRRIFEAAAGDENDVLILGAFGCGAFRNPPRVTAKVFHKMTNEFRKKFEIVEFAVFHSSRETENFEVFRREFQGEM